MQQRLVHLDLKGAAPRAPYLEQVLPLFRALGATGLLLEYEDTFPYTGPLEPLRAPHAYSPAELRIVLSQARAQGLDVVPLVQSFGHMEEAHLHSCVQCWDPQDKRRGAAGAGPVEAVEMLKDGTSLRAGKAEGAGAVQPLEETLRGDLPSVCQCLQGGG